MHIQGDSGWLKSSVSLAVFAVRKSFRLWPYWWKGAGHLTAGVKIQATFSCYWLWIFDTPGLLTKQPDWTLAHWICRADVEFDSFCLTTLQVLKSNWKVCRVWDMFVFVLRRAWKTLESIGEHAVAFLSVCPSVRMEQFKSRPSDICEASHLVLTLKFVDTFVFG